MKSKIIIAFILYLAGLIKIIDWIVFWNQNKELALKNYPAFKSRYIDRFPDFIKPIFNINPEPAAIISVVLFTISGLLFWKGEHIILKILSITAFVFAFWNLFSIM